jgi:adenylate kinase
MLREAVREGTALGVTIQRVMEQGGLIDDDLITELVFERLGRADASRGVLLDGFPRTVAQAKALDGHMADRETLLVLEIAVDETEVMRRLAARMVCAECGANAQDDVDFSSCHNCGGPLVLRADDAEQVVARRLEVYRRQTAPLVKYYSDRGTFVRVDGARMVDDVTAAIIAGVADALDRVGGRV